MVDAFDHDTGRGTVRAGDGQSFAFHCTEIADGAREIAVGTAVTFLVTPGLLGLWEARAVAAIGPGPAPGEL